MAATRHRIADPDRGPHPWSTRTDAAARSHRRRCAPPAAALGVLMLMLSGTWAVASPRPELSQNAPPGTLLIIEADDVFKNPGLNPRFTNVSFSTMDYYTPASGLGVVIFSGLLFVQAKTAEELNALDPPPPSPFTVTAEVTMTNDSGATATGTISFTTSYNRTATPSPSTAPQPTFSQREPQTAYPGKLIGVRVDNWFDNAGTNPRFTSATFSSMEYYVEADTGIRSSDPTHLWVKVKTPAELNALPVRPPNPFTLTANVTMTNDEGATATGTASFKTWYSKTLPTSSQRQPQNAPTGMRVSAKVGSWFDNAGPNPRFTRATFSTMDYYVEADTGIGSSDASRLWVKVKTDAELNALDPAPPSPFTVTANVSMTNDDGATATGTVSFTTNYTRSDGAQSSNPGSPNSDSEERTGSADGTRGTPTLSQTDAISAPPGSLVVTSAGDVFDHAGTHPRFTSATFSTTDYYDSSSSGVRAGSLHVQVKTAAELNALDSPPSSPFTVTANVTMTNDEGDTATGTISFSTTYARDV